MQILGSLQKKGRAILAVIPALTLLISFFATLSSSAQTSGEPNGQVSVAPRKEYAVVVEILERFIAHEMADKELPALSIALVDDQQIVWAKGFGFADPKAKIPATAETVYRVGSVSKLFTDKTRGLTLFVDHVTEANTP